MYGKYITSPSSSISLTSVVEEINPKKINGMATCLLEASLGSVGLDIERI